MIALLATALAQTAPAPAAEPPLPVRVSDEAPKLASPPRCTGARVANVVAFSGIGVTAGSLALTGVGLRDQDIVSGLLGVLGTGGGVGLTALGSLGVGAMGGRCGLRPGERWVTAAGFTGAAVGTAMLFWGTFFAVDSSPAFGVGTVALGGGLVVGGMIPVVRHQGRLHEVRVTPVASQGYSGLVVTGRF